MIVPPTRKAVKELPKQLLTLQVSRGKTICIKKKRRTQGQDPLIDLLLGMLLSMKKMTRMMMEMKVMKLKEKPIQINLLR